MKQDGISNIAKNVSFDKKKSRYGLCFTAAEVMILYKIYIIKKKKVSEDKGRLKPKKNMITIKLLFNIWIIFFFIYFSS